MYDKELSEIFKMEYSNLIAVLCHYYGVQDIQEAEDIVSDTFMKAMKTWAHKGIPDSPKAWLRTSAINILRDQYRRAKNFRENIAPQINRLEADEIPTINHEIIEDSQLRMIFAICHPELSIESQICTALRILCGFNIDEIAKALLSTKDSINKKLYRAKKTLKALNSFETTLPKKEYIQRQNNVLRVIYLLFNEGYYSSVNEKDIRHEICWEAMRLCLLLLKKDDFPKANTYALLALMCFHSSRLQARVSDTNNYILYHKQDRKKWNPELIAKGEKYIRLASTGRVISKYHLEAAIAYWHTTESSEKWANILQLYNKLLTIEYSPVIAMNRTFTLAKTYGADQAIKEAHKLSLKDNHYYHCLLAELYRMTNNAKKEEFHLRKALDLANKTNEKKLISEKLNSIK